MSFTCLFFKPFVSATDVNYAVLRLRRRSLHGLSARRGGPSTDFLLNFRAKAKIMDSGHWLCPASARRYEKHGRLMRQLVHHVTPRGGGGHVHTAREKVGQPKHEAVTAHLDDHVRGGDGRHAR